MATTLPTQAESIPDYAVIQLDQTLDRPALKMSREGFKEKTVYQIMKIDPKSKGMAIGVMVHQSCIAIHNSIINPNSNSDLSTMMSFSECTVIHGNSGSPLIGADGAARGIIEITYDRSEIQIEDTAGRQKIGSARDWN